MRMQFNSLAGVLALAISTAATAQTQPARSTVPATPAQPGPAQTTTVPATPAQPAGTVPDEPATGRATAPGQTQTTPGQSQTSPGQASQITPAQTGQTPSGQTVTSATTADVKAGVSVYDQKGGLVGK